MPAVHQYAYYLGHHYYRLFRNHCNDDCHYTHCAYACYPTRLPPPATTARDHHHQYHYDSYDYYDHYHYDLSLIHI
eukprot:6410889-Alexandrium_andersonii.AAC.1